MRIHNAFSFPERKCESNKRSAVCQVDKTTIFRKFRKNRKKDHFLQSLTLKMVGSLQLKLSTSTLVGFLINGLIMNRLQHIFFASGESRFSIPKIKRSDFSVCFPDFCFSNRKACDLCSPENLSGDHRKHRGKCENSGFSPALQKDQFSLKISPKNEKTDQKTGRRRILKMVQGRRSWTNFSPLPQKCEFSNSLKMGLSTISKISPRDS